MLFRCVVSEPFDEPMTVTTVDGQVVVLGPEAIAAALTPDAAEESGRRLMTAAETARRETATPVG
jgi:hypothetical protein